MLDPSFKGINGQIISVDGLLKITNLMDPLFQAEFETRGSPSFPILTHTRLDLWYELLLTSGLEGMVRAESDLMLFAPVREAFENRFDESVLKYLISPWGKQLLVRILMYHMVR